MFTFAASQISDKLNYIVSSKRKVCLLMLFTFGVYQLSSGAWIFTKAQLAQYLIEQAWHDSLFDKQRHRPWSWADTYPVAELSFKRNKWYVLADANPRNLAFGPTHLSTTPLPGQQGNSVIVGHRDTQFNSLKSMKLGDVIKVVNLQDISHYKVSSLDVVHVKQLSQWQIGKPIDMLQPTITLITCYPFDSLTPNPSHRFVVSAVKIEYASPPLSSI